MKKQGVREGSISKYCFGVVFLYNQIKNNNFKPNLLFINKINDYERKPDFCSTISSPDFSLISLPEPSIIRLPEPSIIRLPDLTEMPEFVS